MNNFSLLQDVIINKNVIEFDYTKSDGSVTHRIGHPYVMYIYTAKDGTESTKLGLVQVGGESDSGKSTNDFKDFLDIGDLSNIVITNETFSAPFHPDYNPLSPRYVNLILKV